MALGLSLNLLSSAVRQAGRMLQQRNFTTLTAAGGMYYSLASPVTLTGDFEIEFDAYFPAQSQFVAVGSQLNFLNHITIMPTKIEVRIAGTRLSFTTTAVNNILNSYRVRRQSGVVTISINGSAPLNEDAMLTTTATMSINVFGQEANDTFSSGIISNLTIKQSGVLIHSWSLDSDGTGAEIDSVGGNHATRVNMTAADTELFTKDGNDWVGSRELTTNGGFDSDTAWVKSTGVTISGGYLNISNTGGWGQTYQALVRPSRYRVDFSVLNTTGGIEVYNGSIYEATQKISDRLYRIDQANYQVGSYDYISFRSPLATTTIDSVSVKRLIEVA